jgi:hypothetical protein
LYVFPWQQISIFANSPRDRSFCCTRSRVKPAAQLGWLFPRNIVPGHVAMSSRFNLQCLMQKLLSRGEFAKMEICCQGNTYNQPSCAAGFTRDRVQQYLAKVRHQLVLPPNNVKTLKIIMNSVKDIVGVPFHSFLLYIYTMKVVHAVHDYLKCLDVIRRQYELVANFR